MLRSSLTLLVVGLISVAVSDDYPWDFFVFTQQWTPAECVEISSEHKCVIPKTVKGWTVHGLWPNKDGSSEDPHDCNASYKFNYAEIKPLHAQLIAQWPNVFVDTKADDFWEHEWNKHGTCSLNLPATHNEYLYFQKGLQLNTQINLSEVLLKKGIKPSNTTGYDVTQTIQMLKDYFGTTPQLNCAYDRKTKRQLFKEVELCMNKTFQFVECDTSKLQRLRGAEGCRPSEQTFLLPFPERNMEPAEKYPDFNINVV